MYAIRSYYGLSITSRSSPLCLLRLSNSAVMPSWKRPDVIAFNRLLAAINMSLR